ncbi:MFS transporter [Aeromicrobium phragmitis]|uniref:MFS transporter n=1 Tax=Aeromicrobium phragmitis TaxID=2478914 RepID=A0A3L8PP97_9ACTN|nr:MFS transporter [Aeromicrobium phragmitis]RLV57207.1 MFS transporter [Aeromicrobium phragmitis]
MSTATKRLEDESPLRIRAFRAVFTSAVFSNSSTSVAYIALPMLAVIELDASPGQVGILATLSTIAFLLIGLPAGAWVDRHHRIMIAADLARALLFATVPVAWFLGYLNLYHLYLVALIGGTGAVFFDIASQSALPRIVPPGMLIRANTYLATVYALAAISGRGIGGSLVALLSAPLATLASALAYLSSAFALRNARGNGNTERPRKEPVPLRRRIAIGARYVVSDAELRALTATAAIANLGSSVLNTMLPLWFVRHVGLSGSALGLFWAVGGIGLLVGSRFAGALANRLGYGRTLCAGGLLLSPAALLVPLIDQGGSYVLASAGWFLAMFKIGLDNILGVSLRQQKTPPELLGRMTATVRFALTGALAVGAGISGLAGELWGVEATLWVGAALVSVAPVAVLLSPVRRRVALVS